MSFILACLVPRTRSAEHLASAYSAKMDTLVSLSADRHQAVAQEDRITPFDPRRTSDQTDRLLLFRDDTPEPRQAVRASME